MVVDRTFRVPPAILGFAGFVVGLLVSFWVAGLFGFSPALMWSSVFLLFLLGVFLLGRPKTFLYFMFIFYGVMFNGILFGRYPLNVPFLGVMDEAILAVPIVYIIMKAIDRQLPRNATYFPLAFVALVALSHFVNRGPLVNTVRVTLSYMKFYIFWYFARAIGPWSLREKRGWFALVVVFAFLQFPLNVIWQSHVVVTIHADASRGTLGSAHVVGYFSLLALFMIGGWLLTKQKPVRVVHVFLMALVAVIIAYNLIFLTDTKHVLFFVPVAALPFFFFPGLGAKRRLGFVLVGLLFMIASWVYLSQSAVSWEERPAQVFYSMKYSGKGSMFRTLTTRLPGEIPFYLLGAGPGNFCSSVGLQSFRPLSNKYVLPYVIHAFRSGGQSAEASVVGTPMCSLFTLWGEFGPIALVLYYGFWIKAARRLWRLAVQDGGLTYDTGQRLAIISGMIAISLVGLLTEVFNLGSLMLSIWTLVAIYWGDEKEPPAPAFQAKPWPSARIRQSSALVDTPALRPGASQPVSPAPPRERGRPFV